MPIVKKQTTKPTRRTSKGGVIGRIKPIGFDNDGIKILLYGRSGTGKTTLWSTFPGPILSIICSGGINSGELRSIDTPANRKKISSVQLQSIAEFAEVINYVHSEGGFQTVVLDHASGLQDLTLKEILGLEELPAQKSWGMASQQQYGQSSLQTKEALRSLLNLDCNVVIIAQEREFNTDSDNDLLEPTVGASLTPSVVGWLNPACDYVCQTFIRPKLVEVKSKVGGKIVKTTKRGKGVEYCLRTEPHDVFITKFRVPKGTPLPDVIVDPDYNKIKSLLS